MKEVIKECDECGSLYYLKSSKMSTMCPECSHIIYGYEECKHEFNDNRCIKCYWDKSASQYIKKLKSKDI